MNKIKVGIVGATGYTGIELLRLITAHPYAELEVITSRQQTGIAVADIFHNLRGVCDLRFSPPESEQLLGCDVVFFATPHGVCMTEARKLLTKGIKVIDLSADFRLKNPIVFTQWYNMVHRAPDLLEQAVYGLPEFHREAIGSAHLIACPGCYPTAVQLGFKPLLESKAIHPLNLIADVKSGVSGAGREGKIANLMAETGESFKAYAVSGHRHQPEIEQGLSEISGEAVSCTFVAHLVPMIRGIEATLYARLKTPEIDIQALYENAYQDEPFIDVMPSGSAPETRSVRGSNTLRIALYRVPDPNVAVISVVEDNLVKGASGQAVQCMNLMFDFPESTGLTQTALLP